MVRMHRVLGFCLLSLVGAAYSQAQATPSAHHSKSAASASKSSSATKKKSTSSSTHARTATHVSKSSGAQTAGGKTASKSGTRGRKVSSKGKRARPKPAPSYQLHPDPERYQQIQQALADRGYFKGQVNGEWGDDSVDALKRFQTDQKLDPDGKINALSLIGLGLGPKHDGTSGRNAPLAVPPESPIAEPQTTDPEPETPAAAPPN